MFDHEIRERSPQAAPPRLRAKPAAETCTHSFEIEHAWTGGIVSEPWTDGEIFEMTRRAAEDPTTWEDGAVPVDIERIREEFARIAHGLSGPGEPFHPIERVRRHAKEVAHHQALMLEAMASVVDAYEEEIDDPNVDSLRGAAMEIAAALSGSRRATEFQLDLAWRLRDRHPSVLHALRSGSIDLRRAQVLIAESTHLTHELASAVIDRVLPLAPGLTTGQLRALIRRMCIELDPGAAAERTREALAERTVTAGLDENHTGTIVASNLPADRVAIIMDRIDRIAREVRSPEETRTIDQIRADVFCDLLEGNDRYQQRGSLDIRVELTTLARLDDSPAELAGYGPVVADLARQMTERFGPSWRVGVTDAVGELIHSATTRRRPDSDTRRHVQMRDRTCVFPGCRAPAERCDLDHCIPYSEGGTTHRHQLYPLCRYHHVNRHRYRWTHTRRADGNHEWRSPLGNTYIRPPPD